MSLNLSRLKKGALRRMLDIPEDEFIPLDVLRAIDSTPIGEVVKNPTFKGKKAKGIGKPEYTVTKLLKARAVLALNMLGWNKPKEEVKPVIVEPIKKTKKVATKKEPVVATPIKKETVKKAAPKKKQ